MVSCNRDSRLAGTKEDNISRESDRKNPQAMFRIGNALGTDEAFAEGVRNVDPSRLVWTQQRSGMGSKALDEVALPTGLSGHFLEVCWEYCWEQCLWSKK